MTEIFGSHLQKIFIGGANIGQSYGLINNKKQKKGLLQDLWNTGFRKIDLSNGYHGSEQIVTETDLPWTVQYKIVLPEIRAYAHKEMNEYLKKKINRLKMTDNFRLVIHNTDYALQAYPIEIFRDLKEMAIQFGVKQFGISTYTRKDFDLVNSKVKCDVVQFPHNVLDNRFLDFGKTIKPLGITYQARSIFLQGLLLKDKGLENWIKKFPEIVNWRNYLKISDRNALECCLLKVVNNPIIDEIVIGFDNKQNVQDFISTLQSLGSNHEEFYQLDCANLELIDPRRWTIHAK